MWYAQERLVGGVQIMHYVLSIKIADITGTRAREELICVPFHR